MSKLRNVTAEHCMCPWCEHEDIYEIWTNKKTDTILTCTMCEKVFVVYLDIRVEIDEDATVDQNRKKTKKEWILE